MKYGIVQFYLCNKIAIIALLPVVRPRSQCMRLSKSGGWLAGEIWLKSAGLQYKKC